MEMPRSDTARLIRSMLCGLLRSFLFLLNISNVVLLPTVAVMPGEQYEIAQTITHSLYNTMKPVKEIFSR
jgi:hypothetical protein